MAVSEVERRLVAILVADVVGYSRLTETDEAGTLAAIRRLRREVIDPLIGEHNGRIVKLMGDGIIVEFGSVVDAVSCAVAMQKETAALQADVAPDRRIIFRTGINLGDVVVEDGDLLGDGVNVAARLQQLCDPGGVLISGTTFDHLRGKLGLPLDYAGEQHVKNIARPVRTYRVRLEGAGLPWRLRLREHANGLRWAGVIILALALAAWSAQSRFATPPVPHEPHLTIAVLPFANVGKQSGVDWLGEGIAEDIMTAVSRFRDLTVIARNSSFRYTGEHADVQKIGRDLNADFVLQGSVRRGGDRVRISVRLADANSGANRWAERYDRPFADIFAIQDEIADHVAAQLVAHARDAAVSRMQTRAPETLEAYELVLRARKAYRTFTHQGTIDGYALAEQAIAIDPDYAPAWEVLARLLNQFYTQPYDETFGTPEMLRQVRGAAEKAVALDPSYSAGHSILGFALASSGELEGGLEELRKSISLNPNDESSIGMHAEVLVRSGHYREAIEAWERRERLDPFRPPLTAALKARAHILVGEFESALALTRSCAERAPELQNCFIYLAIAANELGREEEAYAAVRRVVELNPKFTIRGLLALVRFRNETKLAGYLRRAGFPE